MRSPKDRLRHTLLFEILLIIICTPLLSLVLGKPMETMGALSIILSTIAMILNYAYNYCFDQVLAHMGRPVYERGTRLRMLHAVLFELCLFVFISPVIMVMLDYTFIQAAAYDAGFIIMVPIYAYFFNIAYDHIFPVQAPAFQESALTVD